MLHVCNYSVSQPTTTCIFYYQIVHDSGHYGEATTAQMFSVLPFLSEKTSNIHHSLPICLFIVIMDLPFRFEMYTVLFDKHKSLIDYLDSY